MENKVYACIDLKSFYASVECVERNLNPLTTNLVVADFSRTEKTICLAVSPSLKKLGIKARPRLFEVIAQINEINKQRRKKLKDFTFKGKSVSQIELENNPYLEIDFVIATPRMAFYMEYSSRIYQIYLKYIAKEDIHVYSIDEVFLDITSYLKLYKLRPKQFVMKLIKEVLDTTGITATGGIGTNLYLAKVAMDIIAKHIQPDKDGVRIAVLDEKRYRKGLWDHQPLTDFWRVGRGIAKRLNDIGIYTMGDIARCSLGSNIDKYNEDLLYSLFGINAELLIDHAWGYESCTMKEIKEYKPNYHSLGSGQVLHCPYSYEQTETVIKEMVEQLSLDLVSKNLLTNYISLTIGYDYNNPSYQGKLTKDYLGRKIPSHAHGCIHINFTSSTKIMIDEIKRLYQQIINPTLMIRRIYLSCNIVPANEVNKNNKIEQLNLFTDYEVIRKKEEEEKLRLEKEKKRQETILKIKKKYGKNSIIKGSSLLEESTIIDRNDQIGGHKA